jgi:hypothetical protein
MSRHDNLRKAQILCVYVSRSLYVYSCTVHTFNINDNELPVTL